MHDCCLRIISNVSNYYFLEHNKTRFGHRHRLRSTLETCSPTVPANLILIRFNVFDGKNNNRPKMNECLTLPVYVCTKASRL